VDGVDLPEGKRVQGAALASALAMPSPTTAEVEPEAEAEADTDTDGADPPAKRPKTDDPSIETTVAAQLQDPQSRGCWRGVFWVFGGI